MQITFKNQNELKRQLILKLQRVVPNILTRKFAKEKNERDVFLDKIKVVGTPKEKKLKPQYSHLIAFFTFSYISYKFSLI